MWSFRVVALILRMSASALTNFGVHHVGAQLFAYKPERVVGDILHWSKHYRARSEVDVSYLHGCEVTNFRVNTVRGIPKGVWKIAKSVEMRE